MAVVTLSDYVLQLFFPPRCLLCNAVLPIGGECEACAPVMNALRVRESERTLLGVRGRDVNHLEGVCVSFHYTAQIADLIRRYKFLHGYELFRPMSAIMAEDAARLLDESFDLVMAVPSYRDKNPHAAYLARGVARGLHTRYTQGLLCKIKATPKQHEQTPEERKTNLREAYAVRGREAVRGRTVLLCDDVITSGNTLNECARTLKHAGARAVYACVFSAAGTGRQKTPKI